MFRTVCNSALALLLLSTMLWGGCVSCEQFFMFPGTKSHCCNRSGQCEKPGQPPTQTKTDCSRMSLALDSGGHMDMTPPASPVVFVALAPEPESGLRLVRTGIIREHSPPDLQLLNATFLI